MRTLQEVLADIRSMNREMKRIGIRRMSCFNGGHTPESYRYNADLFRLETEKKHIQAAGASHSRQDIFPSLTETER